ncbi:MAG: addiction module toxin RelE [Anaerolineae bacterium CG03_land_8_20_14_0_80_58_20]|nr:MAG: addiction module toxin RelE [Anaerolineae bacterium CG03_land_8_20_14_0_80_58_20]
MANYQIIYSDDALEHLSFIEKKFYGFIEETLEIQLGWEPGVETKNRKTVRQPAPFNAKWELRFGDRNRFRALYEISEDERIVHILAIGHKIGNRLFIGGEEMEK